jgi:NodT family efflux transporter outer membrane factor (OMF) lipoprotein
MPYSKTSSYTTVYGESPVIFGNSTFKRVVLSGVLILAVVLSGSCAHSPIQELSDLEIRIPEMYAIYDETTPAPDRWWEGFGSGELDTLIGDALNGSLSLKTSLARLKQSKALAIQAGADRLPDLDLKAGASDTWRNVDDETVTTRSRSLTLVSSYEIDFWGRIGAQERSALLELEVSREDLYTAALSLASEITIKWLELILVRRQIGLLHEQLETNRTILDLMELRYLKGMATALDIYQQRQALAETEAALPQLEARLRTLQHELSVLSGKPPRTDLGLSANTFPELGALPQTGIPADLLAKRPDVRAAGLKLRSSEQQMSAARADRLPAVTLTTTAGFSSDRIGELLENWLATLAGNLTYSLFNSGSESAEVERQEAIVEERLASYEETVLTAIREVENAMIREVKQVEYIMALEKQIKISQDGFREAGSRYRKGLSDYLPVLTALTSTQRLQRSIVQAQFERLSYRVALHRALGGSWMQTEFEGKVESRRP